MADADCYYNLKMMTTGKAGMRRPGEFYDIEGQQAANDDYATARQIYDIMGSEEEEAKKILEYYRLSFRGDTTTDRDDRPLRLKALKKFMKVYPTGDPKPLTLYERLWYKSHDEKMISMIGKARKKATQIAGEVDDVGLIDKDQILMQHFVLEQVSPFKRMMLSGNFFRSGELIAGKINFYLWVVGWVFVTCVFLFLLYWTLAWGFNSGSHSFQAWLIVFSISLTQDIFLVQVVKLLLMHAILPELMRAQLLAIYRTLHHIATVFVQEGLDRSDIFCVSQKLSGSCRAARLNSLKGLPAAFILRQIDDIDIYAMRSVKSGKLGLMLGILIGVPSIMAMVSEAGTDTFFGIFVPSVFDGIVLGAQWMLETAPWLLAVAFVGIVYAFIHYYYVLKESKKLLQKVSLKENMNRMMRSSGSMWIVTRRHRGKGGWNRVMANLRVNISKAVVCCWSPFTYFNTPRKAEKARVIKLWRNINVPSGYQGNTGGFEENVIIANLTHTETVPTEIVDMCVHYQPHQRRVDPWLTRYMQSGVFGVGDDLVADSDFSPTYADEEGCIEDNIRFSMPQKVHKNVLRADDTEFLTAHDRFRLTTLTDNFDDIIQRFPLFCIHVDYRDAELLQVNQVIRPACLRQFMEGALCWFTPNGRLLREFEKENVMKEFEEWLKSNTQQVDGVNAVSYGAFQAWLVDLKDFLTTATLVATLQEGDLERLSSLEALRLSEIFRPSSGIIDENWRSVTRSKATADGAGTDTGGAGDRMSIDSFGVTLVEPETDIFTTLRDLVQSLGTPRPHDAANLEEAHADDNGDLSGDEGSSIDGIVSGDQVSKLLPSAEDAKDVEDVEDADIEKEKMSLDVILENASQPEPEPTLNWNNLSPRFDEVASFLGSPIHLVSGWMGDFEQKTTPADIDPGDGKAASADGNEHDASDPERGVEENTDADLPPMSLDESVRSPSNDVLSEDRSNNDEEEPILVIHG
jgi:hypothetical protein